MDSRPVKITITREDSSTTEFPCTGPEGPAFIFLTEVEALIVGPPLKTLTMLTSAIQGVTLAVQTGGEGEVSH